jgi:hypothetical protein
MPRTRANSKGRCFSLDLAGLRNENMKNQTYQPTNKVVIHRLNRFYLWLVLGITLLAANAATAAVTAITVGSQTGGLVYGTAGSATYTLSFPRNANSPSISGLAVSGLPTGASYSLTFTNNTQSGNHDIPSDTLTISISSSTPAGTNTFTVSSTSPVLSNTGKLVVNGKSLSITGVTAANKTYDGTLVAGLSGGTLNGVANGDSVTIVAGSGTFASSSPGTWTVTATGYALGGTDAGKYTLAGQPSVPNATISAKALTVSGLSAVSKTYDQMATAALSGTAALQTAEAPGTGSGVDGAPYTGDTVALSGSPGGTFAGTNVGTGISVTVSGLSLAGAQSGNYTLTEPVLSANIQAVGVTITAGVTANDKVYDQTTAATINTNGNIQFSGLLGGDSLTIITNGYVASFASAGVGSNQPVTVSNLVLGGASAGNYTLLAQPSLTASIFALGVTITSGVTANDKIYDQTPTATINTNGNIQFSGLLGGDNLTIITNGYVASFASASAGSNQTVTVSGIVLGGASAGNYLLSAQPVLTASIVRRTLNVTATGVNKVYDGTTNATVTLSDNHLGGDAVTDSYTAASFGDAGVGTNKTVTVTGIGISGATAGDYAPASTTALTTANISVAMVTPVITLNNKVYDGTTSPTTISNRSLTGVIGTDDVNLGTSGTVAAFSGKTVGSYLAIWPSASRA